LTPAALLIAVFAVAVGPLTEDGAWKPLNTIIGAAVLMIVVPYTAGFAKWRIVFHDRPLPVAVAIVLVLATTVAWPIQRLFSLSPRHVELCRAWRRCHSGCNLGRFVYTDEGNSRCATACRLRRVGLSRRSKHSHADLEAGPARSL